jgi:hypothetical protein
MGIQLLIVNNYCEIQCQNKPRHMRERESMCNETPTNVKNKGSSVIKKKGPSLVSNRNDQTKVHLEPHIV